MPDESAGAGTGPIFVNAAAVKQSISLPDVIGALRRTYAAEQPQGAAGRIVARGRSGARVRALAAVLPDDQTLGAKLHVQPAPGVSSFLIAVFSQDDGALLGLLDGRAITEVRTGATSALALDALAPAGALEPAVLGSGREARSHLRAIASIRPLRHVRVFSPSGERRERFAREMGEALSVQVTACASAEEAVSGATTIIAAARSHTEQPLFDPGVMGAAATIVSVGSTVPEQRELDERVLERAALIVADEPDELLSQSGDCLAAAGAGIALEHRTHSLAELVQNRLPAPIDHTAVNVFKSVGSALQDLTVAALILRSAAASGLGTVLPINLSPKEPHG